MNMGLKTNQLEVAAQSSGIDEAEQVVSGRCILQASMQGCLDRGNASRSSVRRKRCLVCLAMRGTSKGEGQRIVLLRLRAPIGGSEALGGPRGWYLIKHRGL